MPITDAPETPRLWPLYELKDINDELIRSLPGFGKTIDEIEAGDYVIARFPGGRSPVILRIDRTTRTQLIIEYRDGNCTRISRKTREVIRSRWKSPRYFALGDMVGFVPQMPAWEQLLQDAYNERARDDVYRIMHRVSDVPGAWKQVASALIAYDDTSIAQTKRDALVAAVDALHAAITSIVGHDQWDV